jgi:hypothetical protein
MIGGSSEFGFVDAVLSVFPGVILHGGLFRSTLFQLLQYHLLQALRRSPSSPPPDNLAIPANQKLFKIPLDPLQAPQARLALLEPLPDLVLVRAIDVALCKHGKRDAVVAGAEGLDLGVGEGLLAEELVGGEAEDQELVGVRGVEFAVQLFERAVLWRVAAAGGGVDEEDYFAFEGGEAVGLSAGVGVREGVEGLRGGCGAGGEGEHCGVCC